MSRRNQPNPTQFLQQINKLRDLHTLSPDEKWGQLSRMLRDRYDRSAKGEPLTHWNTESALQCNIDIFESILDTIDLLPLTERVSILSGTTPSDKQTLWERLSESASTTAATDKALMHENPDRKKELLFLHAVLLMEDDYVAGLNRIQQVIPVIKKRSSDFNHCDLSSNNSRNFKLRELADTKQYDMHFAKTKANQIHLTSHFISTKVDYNQLKDLMIDAIQQLMQQSFTATHKLAIINTLNSAAKRHGCYYDSVGAFIKQATWQIEAEKIYQLLNQSPLNKIKLKKQLIRIRVDYNQKKVSQTDLEVFIAKSAVTCLQSLDDSSLAEARQLFIDILGFSDASTIKESLQHWDSSLTKQALTQSTVNIEKILSSLPQTVRPLIAGKSDIFSIICTSQRPLAEKKLLILELIYYAHQQKLALNVSTALSWLVDNQQHTNQLLTILVKHCQKHASTQQLDTLFDDFNQADSKLADSENTQEILARITLLKQLRLPLDPFLDKFSTLRATIQAPDLIEQFHRLGVIRNKEQQAITALAAIRSATAPLSHATQQQIIGLLQLIPKHKRNEYFSFHDVVTRTTDAQFIYSLWFHGINAKTQNRRGEYPHERIESGEIQLLLQQAATGKKIMQPATTAPVLAIAATCSSAKDEEALPLATVISEGGGGGGGGGRGGGGCKDTELETVESEADTDPAQLKTEDGNLTEEGQLNLIHRSLFGQAKFLWITLKRNITFAAATNSLFSPIRDQPTRERTACLRLFFLAQACDTSTFRRGEGRILGELGFADRKPLSEHNLALLFQSRPQPAAERPPAFNPAVVWGGGGEN